MTLFKTPKKSPETEAVVTQPVPKLAPWYKRRNLLVAGLAAVLLLAGAWLAYVHFRNTQPYKYTYQALSQYKYDFNNKGTGVAFLKPNEFKPSILRATTVELDHILVNKQKTPALIGKIVISSVPFKTQPTDTQRLAYGYYFSRPQDKNYLALYAPIKAFASQAISSHYTASLDNAQPFTSSYILKDEAWQFNLAATGKDTKNQIDKVQGKIIFAIGKNAYYYFLFASPNNNWQSNQPTWQKVFDSLKLDQ